MISSIEPLIFVVIKGLIFTVLRTVIMIVFMIGFVKLFSVEYKSLTLGFLLIDLQLGFTGIFFKNCISLVSLTLGGKFVLHVPKNVGFLFPCLKKINLVSIVYSGDQSFTNLISGCPVLEELFVERQLIGLFDNMKKFMIISPSLKRLRLSFALCGFGGSKLEYLNILDVMSTTYSLTKPLFLTEAHIKIRTYGGVTSIAQLVTLISSVKILTLTQSTIRALSSLHDINMPMFPNLVKFVIGYDADGAWNELPTHLYNMPNLEHITFADVSLCMPTMFLPFPPSLYIKMKWRQPVEVPACLRFKMKEIRIENRETISLQEFMVILKDFTFEIKFRDSFKSCKLIP